MAANVMELLRQIQRDLDDQKEFMRDLHVTNRNINEKIDKQQVTIEIIHQHVKKNNMVLFGNDDAQIDLEHTTAVSYKTHFEENKEKDAHLVEKNEKYMENIEADQMQINEKGTKFNCDDDNKRNYSFEKPENDKSIEEFITKEIREMKESIKDFIATTKTSIEEASKQETVPPTNDMNVTDLINNLNEELKNISDVYQSDTKDMKESIDVFAVTIKTFTEEFTNLIYKLNDKLEIISNKYQSDMKEMKESINDLTTTMKISTENTASIINKQKTVSTFPNNLGTEEVSKLRDELNQINETYQSEIKAKKDLIDDILASIKKTNEVAASQARKQVAVQITPTYLNTEQITKLNEELKRITEMYASTDVFPIIEVQSGPFDHPVMKLLSKGVYYKRIDDTTKYVACKIAPFNLKRSEVLELVTEYPHLSLTEVIKAIGTSRNEWADWCKQYNFNIAYHKTADGYAPLHI